MSNTDNTKGRAYWARQIIETLQWSATNPEYEKTPTGLTIEHKSGEWPIMGIASPVGGIMGYCVEIEGKTYSAITSRQLVGVVSMVHNITRQNITDLRAEAGAAGDTDQVDLCDRALEGDTEAWGECAAAIRAARAMKDD